MGVYIWKEGAEEYNLADIASQSVNPPSGEIKTVTITFDDAEPTWKSLTVNRGNILLSVAQSTSNTIIVLGWVSVDLSQYGQSSSHTRGTVSYDFVQHTYSIDIIATIDGVDVPYQRNNAPLAGYISTIDSRDMTSSITLSGNIKIEAIPEQLDLKNAYIGEYQEGWQPGANTVAYYPLTSTTTVNDMKGSGTAQNLTNSNVSFGTQFGVDCAYISGNADNTHVVSKYLYGNITGLPTGSSARTYSFWIYNNNSSVPSVADDMYIFQGQASTNKMVFINGGGVDSSSGLAISQRGTSGYFGASIRQQRCHNVITYDGTKFEWYVNGVSRGTWTYTINTGSNKFSIFGASENPFWNAFNGGMSELILENKVRTAQEKLNYYNQTKSLYGIS